MRFKRHILGSSFLVVIVGAALLFAYRATSEVGIEPSPSSKVSANPFPRKGWTVGFHAFRIKGYKDLPVKVYGVASAGLQGLQAARVTSQADKIVIGVRIKWFVGVKGSNTILTKGETALIDLPGLVGALPKFEVQIPDATLEKILTPVMKKRQLRGDFDVHVMVSEVKYLDGSFWNLAEPADLTFEALRKHHAALDLCAGQTCRLAADLFAYQCDYAKGESCENYGESCISSMCELYMQ